MGRTLTVSAIPPESQCPPLWIRPNNNVSQGICMGTYFWSIIKMQAMSIHFCDRSSQRNKKYQYSIPLKHCFLIKLFQNRKLNISLPFWVLPFSRVNVEEGITKAIGKLVIFFGLEILFYSLINHLKWIILF